MPDPVHSARSRHALTVHKFGAASAQAQQTKRELIAAKLIREILTATTQPPTLTNAQRETIAGLILTTSSGVA